MSAVMDEFGLPVVYPNGKQAWRCDGCGLVGPWGNSWIYWGTVEGGLDVPTFCCLAHTGWILRTGGKR